jgi:hypothetical protein
MSSETPYVRIATALETHCDLRLGDVSAIDTPEEFARLVEVAAANFGAGRKRMHDSSDDDGDAGRAALERRLHDPEL